MIGLFDSGLGGLSVLDAIAKSQPQSDLIYVADTAHVPYGEKSEAFIRARVLAIGQYLSDAGCSQIVVACNTATAAAVMALRERLPEMPIIGVEPGIKPAVSATRSGRIAVLATTSTAHSERLAKLIEKYASSVTVDILPCPGWATRVEAFDLTGGNFIEEARERLQNTLANGSDQIVLGCTHYSFLAPALRSIIGSKATLVDVSEAIARQSSKLARPSTNEQGHLKLLSTANPERLQQALGVFELTHLSEKMDSPAQQIDI